MPNKQCKNFWKCVCHVAMNTNHSEFFKRVTLVQEMKTNVSRTWNCVALCCVSFLAFGSQGSLLAQDRIGYVPPADNAIGGVQASLSGASKPFEIEALHIAPNPLESVNVQDTAVQHYTSLEAEMAPMEFQPQGVPNYVDFGHSSHHGNVMPADCCMGCDRSYYVNAEAIWFNRSGDRGFSLSRAGLMDPFSFEIAGRITVGQMFDCLDGVEVVYTGPLDWSEAARSIVRAW